MTGVKTLEQPIMTSTDVAADDFPNHANVLALVSAYTQATGEPMPWAAIVEVVERLQLEGNPAGLEMRGSLRVGEALGDIVTDLRRLNLLHFGVNGTDLTAAGEEMASRWNGRFTQRRESATTALRELRVI
ncbi:hypothetical protein [Phycicoccus flavus]|uniref:hypothetical protein n=1 Tax=Phycicoccus flavus TaxID=2502783 RepID=UPI000FEB63D6|nr:hypothetical protein [Phycicoccus flavus]NHA67723.1 hypothetical protein [Phycicoccus flavus]